MREDYEIGVCPKCDTEFEPPDGEVSRSGYLCPECKRMGFFVVGVINFSRKPWVPEEVTTA